MVAIVHLHHTSAYSYFAAAGIILVSLFIWLWADTRLTRQRREESRDPDWSWPQMAERNTDN